jgi:hypothetical protein
MSVRTLYASAARTATPTAVDFDAGRAKALFIVIDITAVTATPAVTVTVSGVDSLSGKVWTLLASAALATVSTTVLQIGPGVTAATNLAANAYIPDFVRVAPTHGDSDSATYTITAHLA